MSHYYSQVIEPVLMCCSEAAYNADYTVENAFRDDGSVYCATSHFCDLIFEIPQGCISEIFVRAPNYTDYTSPVDQVEYMPMLSLDHIVNSKDKEGYPERELFDSLRKFIKPPAGKTSSRIVNRDQREICIEFDAPLAANYVFLRLSCVYGPTVDIERIRFKAPQIGIHPTYSML